MGRKIKVQLILLSAILLIIYGKQEIFAREEGAQQDSEKMKIENMNLNQSNQGTWDFGTRGLEQSTANKRKVSDSETLGPDKTESDQRNPGKPDPEKPDQEKPEPDIPDPEQPEPDTPDPEQPDPEKPEPDNPKPEKPEVVPIEKYEVQFGEPDGLNGYYIKSPAVKVKHVSKRGITKYCFTDGGGTQIRGVLTSTGEELVLEESIFKEGTNVLEVWMEAANEVDDEGTLQDKAEADTEEYMEVPESRESWNYVIDRTGPVIQAIAPNGFDYWYADKVPISVSGEDAISGCAEVACYAQNSFVGSYTSPGGIFQVDSVSSEGRGIEVVIHGTDQAGNTSKLVKQLYIDRKSPEVQMEGAEDYIITSKDVELVYRVQEENILGEFWAEVQWEGIEGQQASLPGNSWEQAGQSRKMIQQLNQEGRYRIKLFARDRAGHESSREMQIIIDKNNPIIASVDEMDGRYMQEFKWDYDIGNVVKDYTTYTYHVQLDSALYAGGERVTKEGRHQLKVQATDAAGNSSEAKSEFVIDHTSPEIQITGAQDGKAYEEENTIEIRLKDTADWFREIKINGKRQKINPDKKVYSYTMKEYRDFDVSVMAMDRAGNENIENLIFEVVPKPTIMEEMLEPVKKALGMETHIFETDEGTSVNGRKEKTENQTVRDRFMFILFVLVFVAGILFFIRKYRDKIEKFWNKKHGIK